MKLLNLKGFSEETINHISEAKKEPKWMRELRFRCLERYKGQPLPDSNEESWRRTSFNSLNFDEIQTTYNNQFPDTITNSRIDKESYLAYKDSSITHNYLSKYLEEKGVIFTDMDTALIKHPDLIKEYFMSHCVKPELNAFTMMHAAFWNGGIFLYVPRGVEIEVPIKCLYASNKNGLGLFYHTLIVLEESSRAYFLEESSSTREAQSKPKEATQSFNCPVVEIYLKENSSLNYLAVQDFGHNVYSAISKSVILKNNSSIKWTECTVGGRVTKSHLESTLVGQGASTNMLGISFVDGNHHLDASTSVHHKVPHTSGNILFKGVVNDNGTSIFQGMIQIDHDAQHTDSFMGNHNLLLSDNAKADSIPKLEIKADEVRATHGVTVGQVDKEQLFYLMSRGINEEDAKEMIVDGFLESIVGMADQTTEQESLRYFIKKKREENARDGNL